MIAKRLVVLGSTGSIGRSTLEVVSAHPDSFVVRALAAYSNVDLLVKQYLQYRPEYVCLVKSENLSALRERLAGQPVKVVAGEDEMIKLTALNDVDMVVNAVVGAAGLRASLETVRQGRPLSLANK